jgi:2-oxoglutarate dehydrogenase E2 component (dihydrolipoamide succinyltransferase)
MDIKVPQVGESVFEAEIGTWHKKDGDHVEKDELLCELETDKITLELNADAEGILSIKAKEGETVAIGAVIGTIEEGAGAKEQPAEPKGAAKKKGPKKEEKIEKKAEKKEEEEKKAPEEKQRPAPSPTPAPEAKKPAEPEEKPPKKAPAPAPPAPAREGGKPGDTRVTRQPMSRLRKTIAEHMLAARQQTAMLTTFNEADMSRVMDLRRKHREAFQKKHGVSLGLMSFFVKASVEALKEFPMVNARIEGDDLVFQNFYDIGIAVGSEKGLLVPILRDADRLHFSEIEQAIGDYAEKIRTNQIGISDLEGGTFTISNGGVYGSLLSTPILNPPQSAVLGMHAIQQRPVAVEGQVEIRPMMYLALSYDHRIIDGREAVTFLKKIKDTIEDPEELLLEL